MFLEARYFGDESFTFTFGALGGLLFGFDTEIISGASPLIESNFNLNIAQTGFITSSVLIGSSVGALGVGPLADKYGRKKLLILAAILFLLGSSLSIVAVDFWSMVVARIILGFAVGLVLPRDDVDVTRLRVGLFRQSPCVGVVREGLRKMKISFPFVGQTLPDEYGINQPADQLIDGINLKSLPFTVTDFPKETTHLAFSVIDYDTIPVVGYPWIHWLVADVAVTRAIVTVPADASQTADLIQGTNSMANIIDSIQTPANFTKDLTRCYTGPRPRGGIHQYRVDVYALREPLNLAPGFLYNTFLEKLDGRVCQQTHAYLAYARK